jgi:hypothetical protein
MRRNAKILIGVVVIGMGLLILVAIFIPALSTPNVRPFLPGMDTVPCFYKGWFEKQGSGLVDPGNTLPRTVSFTDLLGRTDVRSIGALQTEPNLFSAEVISLEPFLVAMVPVDGDETAPEQSKQRTTISGTDYFWRKFNLEIGTCLVITRPNGY